MNEYRIMVEITKDYDEPGETLYVGEAYFTVEAESAEEAQRKVIDKLVAESEGTRHHYSVVKTTDLKTQREPREGAQSAPLASNQRKES